MHLVPKDSNFILFLPQKFAKSEKKAFQRTVMKRAILLKSATNLYFVKKNWIRFFTSVLQTVISCSKRLIFGPQLKYYVLRIFLDAINFSGFSLLHFNDRKGCERCYKLKNYLSKARSKIVIEIFLSFLLTYWNSELILRRNNCVSTRLICFERKRVLSIITEIQRIDFEHIFNTYWK